MLCSAYDFPFSCCHDPVGGGKATSLLCCMVPLQHKIMQGLFMGSIVNKEKRDLTQ
jgi:hypothetical protein